jgi:hypothetical protein
MKMKFSEILSGSCFQRGKRGGIRKKLPDGRVATVSKTGKAKMRALKGDPEVETVSCPLNLLGVGLRKNPDAVIEIGSSRRRLHRR